MSVDEPLVERYERGVDALEALARSVPAHLMEFSPAEDAWSIREILVHLSDAEIVYSERLRRAVGDDGATIFTFDETAWGHRLRYSARDPQTSLALMRALRTANADLLRQLDDAAWRRTATHPHAGPITASEIVHALVEHMDYHLAQIRGILAAKADG